MVAADSILVTALNVSFKLVQWEVQRETQKCIIWSVGGIMMNDMR